MKLPNDIATKLAGLETKANLSKLVLQTEVKQRIDAVTLKITTPKAEIPQPLAKPLAELKPGQQLVTTVISKTPNGEIKIQVNQLNAQLNLANNEILNSTNKSNIPAALKNLINYISQIKPGQTLLFEILKSGKSIELKFLPPETATNQTNKQTSTNNPVNQAIRNFIATQRGLAPLLANIQHITKSLPAETLPQPVAQQTKILLENLSTIAKASTPEGLKQALDDSGNFLEAKLAKQLQTGSLLPNLHSDLKGTLLKLRQLIQYSLTTPIADANTKLTDVAKPTIPLPNTPAPPLRTAQPEAQASAKATLPLIANIKQMQQELMQQIDSALSRIRLSQIANVPEGEQKNLWLLEIPIRQEERVDIFHLRIDRDGSAGSEDPQKHTWTVRLAFDLPELGAIHTVIRVFQDIISTRFWAEKPNTVEQIQNQLTLLQQELEQEGLTIEHISCQQGTPPNTQKDSLRPTILDEKV